MTGSIIHIEQCGFLTTLQDAGRKGFQQFGVSKGGAMDVQSAVLANILTGNDETEAVLEITQSPHRFHFLQDTVVAFTGGGLQPQVNHQPIQLYQPVFIAANTVVELKQQLPGLRLYMAVAGGYESDSFLYSHSTYLLVKAGGHHGRPLKKDDRLSIKQPFNQLQKNVFAVLQSGATVQLNYSIPRFQTNIIRIIKGIEWETMNHASQTTVTATGFKVSAQSNRMGYRLSGTTLQTEQPCEIISSPVTQGTIQLTPSGELIVLMADGQTVGGYPRIAQVCAADIPVLAQKKPGDEIHFQLIGFREAEELYLNAAKQLNIIKQTLQQLYAS